MFQANIIEEEGAYRIIAPLDPESAKKVVGKIVDALKSADSVEEVGENYIVLKIPRFARFMGSRRAKLYYKVYETEDTILFVAKGRVDSLIIAVDVIDTGEGAHIVVSGGGAGGASKVAGRLVRGVAEYIVSKLRGATPEISVRDEDNELAALQEAPPQATLVYIDSFTPVHNVVLEAAQRILALLDYDEYLIEVTDFDGNYLLRILLRGDRITGLYARLYSTAYRGVHVLASASRPPSYRVRIRAWSLTGRGKTMLYAPELVYDTINHKVYWLHGRSSLEYGVSANTYAIISGQEAAIVDPSGDERTIRGLKNILQDFDVIRYILLSAAEPDNIDVVRLLTFKAGSSTVLALPYDAAMLASTVPSSRIRSLSLKEHSISLGATELYIIPSRARKPPALTVYDKLSRTLFSGAVLSAISPPGLWSPFMDDLELYDDMVLSYVKYSTDAKALKEWLESIATFDVEILAPKYGPILRGKANIERLFSLLAGM